MCGIAGIFGLAGRPVELDELRAMSAMPRPSRPGRRRLLPRRERRARHAAAVHHRPRVGPAAGAQRGRLGVGRVQRRDLQLPRAAARAAGPRAHLHDDRPTPRSSSTSTRSSGRAASTSCAGMFAFALWDAAEAAAPDRPRPPRHQAALLRRGRRTALFASELKALLALPDVERRIDWAALGHLLDLPGDAALAEHRRGREQARAGPSPARRGRAPLRASSATGTCASSRTAARARRSSPSGSPRSSRSRCACTS